MYYLVAYIYILLIFFSFILNLVYNIDSDGMIRSNLYNYFKINSINTKNNNLNKIKFDFNQPQNRTMFNAAKALVSGTGAGITRPIIIFSTVMISSYLCKVIVDQHDLSIDMIKLSQDKNLIMDQINLVKCQIKDLESEISNLRMESRSMRFSKLDDTYFRQCMDDFKQSKLLLQSLQEKYTNLTVISYREKPTSSSDIWLVSIVKDLISKIK